MTAILRPGPSLARLGVARGGISYLLRDTFTDTDGTTLAAHAMDTGPGWTLAQPATKTIVSNKTSNQDVPFGANAGSPDGTVAVDIVMNNSDAHMGPTGRMLDATNFWMASLLKAESLWCIVECTGGTYIVRASAVASLNTGQTYRISAVFNGTSIVATYDGANQLSFTMGTGAGRTGFGLRGPAVFDNFQVTR